MRKLLTVMILFFGAIITTNAQTNFELLSKTELASGLNDIWGYVDDSGREYAIVGRLTGTSVVDISNPTNPEVVYDVPGGYSVWRDIKVFGHYAYIVDDEAGEGLLIIDMSGAPTDFTHTYITQVPGGSLTFCHNIYIEEKTGFAYLFGCQNTIADGAIIMDLKNYPMNPELAGIYNTAYIHDGYVRNDTMWASQINVGNFAAVDVSDKTNPIVLGTKATSSTFTHNCWLSDNGQVLYTTDEVSGGFIDSYDVSDLSNIQELDRIQSNPGSGVIPHNTFAYGNFLVTSYYRDGVTIHDATRPDFMVQVGEYDTSPNLEGDGFNGSWGVYPYLPSGLVIAADIEEGLYVLQPTYQRACYLTVTVQDAESGLDLANAQVELLGTDQINMSAFNGKAELGVVDAGTYTVQVLKDGYIMGTAEVSLLNGEETEVTVLLEPTPIFNYNFTVVDPFGQPIPNAQATFISPLSETTGISDESGNIQFNGFFQSTFEIVIGAWGYLPYYAQALEITEANTGQVFMLSKGYYDDFALDLGWSVTGDAPIGTWERGVPIGNSYQGNDYTPFQDNQDDFGNQCFVTGNGSGQPGSSDVDDGATILTSPTFDLSDYIDPYINVQSWFANGGGNGSTPDDVMEIIVSNGNESVIVKSITYQDPMFQWVEESIKLTDFIELTENMTISFRAEDDPNTHLLDAAIDVFSIVDLMSVEEPTFALTGQIKDEDGNALDGIMLSILNDNIGAISLSTDENGNFLIDLPEGEYNIIAGQWGYITQVLDPITLGGENAPILIKLEEGYQDDFSLDFGWTVNGDANNGEWERGIPEGTNEAGIDYNPANDLTDDIGNICYVTGAEGGNIDDNDVDNGATVLRSPDFDLADYENPYISFSRWYATAGEASEEFVVQLSNGQSTVTIEEVGAQDAENHNWYWTNIRVMDYIEPSSLMNISFIAADEGDDHTIEAAIDGFAVADSSAIENNLGLSDVHDWSIQARPNPFKNILILELQEAETLLTGENIVKVIFYDILGNEIESHIFEEAKLTLETTTLSSGAYFYSIQSSGKILKTGKVIKK